MRRKKATQPVSSEPIFGVICSAIGRRFGVNPADFVRPGRKEPLSTARHCAIQLVRERLGEDYSDVAISEVFGRSPAQIRRAATEAVTRRETDRIVKQALTGIEDEIDSLSLTLHAVAFT